MPQRSNDPASSSFATKSEVSCFKLKGEDYHFSHTSERVQGYVCGSLVSVEYAIVGVLDGHGGKKAAEFSSKQVPIVFSSLIQDRLPPALECQDVEPYLKLTHVSEEQQRIWALQDAVVEVTPAALRDTFIQVHDDFLTKDMDSGTTATVVVLCGSHVMTANVGDSLAYADLGTRVQQLTSNHRIDENTSEQRRIESSGGELGQAALDGKPVGPLRVWPGGLAFSRSLGDRHAGERVLAEPEVSQMLLDERGARIILASDGLWDVLTGKNAAHRVRTVAYSKAAARLRSVAKEQRDRDDITVIVLDALDGPSSRLPAALLPAAESRRTCDASSAGTPVHQLWHPLTCSEHRWKEQWSNIIQTRSAADSEMTHFSDQDASASTDENVSQQTAMPALLYEEVRSITSILNATKAPEQEWTAVPSRHASSRSQLQQNRQETFQQDAGASVTATAAPSLTADGMFGVSAPEGEDRQPRNQGQGRGRGRDRGRGQGRFGSAGRGRGRGRGNMGSSEPTEGTSNNPPPISQAGTSMMESAGLSKSSGSDDTKIRGPEKRRNAGRGRHARKKSGGNSSGNEMLATEGPQESPFTKCLQNLRAESSTFKSKGVKEG